MLLSYMIDISGQIHMSHDDVSRVKLELIPMIQEIVTELRIIHYFGTTPSESPAFILTNRAGSVEGAPQALQSLSSEAGLFLGKKLIFVTNTSTKSRKKYAEKFQSLGISVSEDEIFSSSFAAAMYLKVNNFPKEKKRRKRGSFVLEYEAEASRNPSWLS